MTRVTLTGHADWNGESLDVDGIGLMIRRTSGGTTTETGAGLWPSVEKAQEIAATTALRILGPDCSVVWTPVSD